MWTVQTDERRTYRSTDRAEALHLQLVHAAEVFDFEAFTLATGDGDLVATSTSSFEGSTISDLLAAFSPILTEDRMGAERSAHARQWLSDELSAIGIAWDPEEMTVHEFFVGDERFFLTAVGGGVFEGDISLRDMGIFRVIFGVRRIWTNLNH